MNQRRTASMNYALAKLGCTPRQIDRLIRSGRLTRPTVQAPDFDLDQVDELAAELAKEQAP